MATPHGISLDVPNLDDASIDPGDYDILAEHLRRIAGWCELKARVMRIRANGEAPISVALRYEQQMNKLFDEFPAWATW